MFKWLRQALCKHEHLIQFNAPKHINMKCWKCGAETPGWTL